MNEVDDVRPVLDFYKQQGGEDKVLDTFKANQARLRAEEERLRAEREQVARDGVQRKVGGAISPFSFRSYSRTQTVAQEVSMYVLCSVMCGKNLVLRGLTT